MAIAFGTASFKTGTAAGSGAVTEPASAAAGDVFVALALVDAGSTSLARPASWVNVYNGTTGAGGMDYDVSYIVRGAGAPSLTWSWTTSNYYEVHILRFTGVDNTMILDLTPPAVFSMTSGQKGTTQAASEIDPPSITPASDNCGIVAIGGHWTGSVGTGWTAPTNYTLRSDNTIGNDGMLATRVLVGGAGGAENPNEFFNSGSVGLDHLFAMTIALREAGAGAALAIPVLTRQFRQRVS